MLADDWEETSKLTGGAQSGDGWRLVPALHITHARLVDPGDPFVILTVDHPVETYRWSLPMS